MVKTILFCNRVWVCALCQELGIAIGRNYFYWFVGVHSSQIIFWAVYINQHRELETLLTTHTWNASPSIISHTSRTRYVHDCCWRRGSLERPLAKAAILMESKIRFLPQCNSSICLLFYHNALLPLSFFTTMHRAHLSSLAQPLY